MMMTSLENKEYGGDFDDQGWRRVDARILGQILAAQNVFFVLPDERRIAEFFSQAMAGIPGVASSLVHLWNRTVPDGVEGKICAECTSHRNEDGEDTIVSGDLTSGMAVDGDAREILLKTNENVFGSFVFRIDSSGSFEPYWPFLCNLANYVALSLENRMQKILLEGKNQKLEEMNRLFIGRELRMKELKDKIAELEKKVHAED